MAKDARGRELPKGIRQRDNGTFEGRVAVDGKRVSVYGNTVTEVKKKIAENKYKMEHGIYVDQCNISFDEWFNTWLEEYKKNSVKSGTVFSYKNYYKYYIKDELGMRKLRDLRGEHIQHLYNKLKQDGIATSTIKIVSAVLSGCMKQALKNGLIERNPVPLAILPKAGVKKQSRVLTQEEQTLFLKYAKAKDSYLYNFFALALRTGMRNGELRGLKYSDIDKKKMVIRTEENGTISFGDYEKNQKSKVSDYPHQGDMYKVKTFKEITKLERNGMFVYESVPGTAVFDLAQDGSQMSFRVEGPEDAQITVELEAEAQYEVYLDGASTGKMETNLGGKLSFSVELGNGSAVDVKIVKC